MLNKKLILVLSVFVLLQLLFAKEKLYKVLDTDNVYKYAFIDRKSTYVPIKIDNPIVELDYNMGKTFGITSFTSEGIPLINCAQNGRTIYVPYDNIIPNDTENLITEKYLSKQNDDYVWIPSYYLEVVKNGDRELIRKYNPEIVLRYGEPNEYSDGWYEYTPMKMFITNSCIDFQYGHIYIDNINIIKDGFKIETENFRYISELSEDKTYVIQFIFDGDFVELYCDNSDNPLLKYCKIKKDDYEQLKKFIHIPNIYFLPNFYGNNKEALNQFNKKNSIDQTIFTWPRHADGSCDYDENKTSTTQTTKTTLFTNVTQNKTMLVNENLKLRSGEATSTQVLSVMSAGTKVKILELGKAEKIDGISSNWVKVEVLSDAKDRDGKPIKAGTVGWCYGGYLE